MPICQLCDRDCPKLTVHHLIPKQQTKRKKQDIGPTADICAPCHKQVHTLFDNKQLACDLNSIEKLRSRPEVQKFLSWIRKQDPSRRVRTYR
ncbi:MAG: HNH endonuclease [Leptolyngbya sp. SIO4C1]|nr:HNH endonuclease [Leptolyngbya sp. SIO4C1]